MNERINSNKIKCALMHNFVFSRGYIGSTEIYSGFGIADTIFIKKKNPKDVVEIEIKISKADLIGEFKHKQNKHTMIEKEQCSYHAWQANKYYFCVPLELVEFTKELLTKYNKSKYGIIAYQEIWRPIKSKKVERLELEESVQIVKSALNLRPKEIIPKEVFDTYKQSIELRNNYLVNTLMRQVYFSLDKASMKIYRPMEKK